MVGSEGIESLVVRCVDGVGSFWGEVWGDGTTFTRDYNLDIWDSQFTEIRSKKFNEEFNCLGQKPRPLHPTLLYCTKASFPDRSRAS